MMTGSIDSFRINNNIEEINVLRIAVIRIGSWGHDHYSASVGCVDARQWSKSKMWQLCLIQNQNATAKMPGFALLAVTLMETLYVSPPPWDLLLLKCATVLSNLDILPALMCGVLLLLRSDPPAIVFMDFRKDVRDKGCQRGSLVAEAVATERNRFPFTPSQWQELEHQALIYKYMASGISVPPDLLFTIKRSYLDSPLSSRLLPHQPQHFGWNYLPMGLGRKIDPEPGRCRRTDGKKWRCSKEAYPDSKYCERHMHRGKNRSRKPVEVLKTTTSTTAPTTPTTPTAANADASTSTPTILSITKNSPALTPTTHSSLSHDTYHHHHHTQHHSFLYPSRPSSGVALSFQDNSAPLFLDTASCSQNNNTDCRYVYGLKEEVDEHAFFTEPSGTMRSFSASSMDDSWQLTPLTISSSSSSKQRTLSALSNDNNEYSYLQLQTLNNNSKQPHQDHGCYISGTDIKCESFMKLGKEEPQRTVHRFFDEWPPKSRGSWLDLDDKSSTTQLSISIPTSSSHDFTTFSSTSQRDG
ncbi:hypothetical protein VNO77_05431 [Canavalia gladiata]|uniref:Growth-regulating factor n=1 Tax=Canavalia gladiata TaxID=3824 RepID=A0AAN9MYC0_CANGL